MTAVNATDDHICPTCGNTNGCGTAKGEATCWCFALPHVLSVSQENDRGRCYCRPCLERVIDARLAVRGSGAAGETG
jgi:hypothetical protein